MAGTFRQLGGTTQGDHFHPASFDKLLDFPADWARRARERGKRLARQHCSKLWVDLLVKTEWLESLRIRFKSLLLANVSRGKVILTQNMQFNSSSSPLSSLSSSWFGSFLLLLLRRRCCRLLGCAPRLPLLYLNNEGTKKTKESFLFCFSWFVELQRRPTDRMNAVMID